MSLYDELRNALRDDRPVALATIIDGPGIGRKLLVGPDREPGGTLGNEDLDRVVSRDALGQLLAGRTDRRNYGARGEARETVVDVFI
ncbi:MAG: XdhC family protein, partial [Acidimicrobiales bacterium]